ncbi:unnamed protein product, partial [Mesorhabditis spiculigera]
MAIRILGALVVTCPPGFKVHKTDVTLHKVSSPKDILYQHSTSNNNEFCISTQPIDVKRGERLVLNIDYTCRHLLKVCSYADSAKVPILLKSEPFTPRFAASDDKKIRCGRMRFDPDEIENKHFIFVHP